MKTLQSRIKQFFKQAGKKKAVLGLSGGIDSSLCLKLLVDALKPKNVTALILPEKGITSEDNIKDSIELCQISGVKHFYQEINPFLASFDALEWPQTLISRANTKARIRAIILYNYANANNALVAGTSNKSEMMLGYGTKYGDLAADVYIIGSLYKTEVLELAKQMQIPEKIIKKKPSAELYIGQTDEDELGFTYEKIDQMLKDNTFDERIRLRIEKNRHKREPVPIL